MCKWYPAGSGRFSQFGMRGVMLTGLTISLFQSGKLMRSLFVVSVLCLSSTAVLAGQGGAYYLGDDSGAFAASRKVQQAAKHHAVPAIKRDAVKKDVITQEVVESRPAAAPTEVPAAAAKVRSQPVAATPKPDVLPDLGLPFDSSVGTLAVPVAGNDIKQLYTRLVSIKSRLEQRQAESTEQYQDRISAIDPCRLGSDIRCDSKLAFYERTVLDAQYSAESGTMTVAFYLNDESVYSTHRREPGRYALVEIANNVVSERNVVRQASGESASVLRIKGEAWALSVWADSLGAIISKATPQYYECSMSFSMPGEWVQEFNDGIFGDVGLLYVGTLDNAPAYEDRDYGSAMMGMPYSKDVRRYSIKFRLAEIWVVNRATGRVYGKHIL